MKKEKTIRTYQRRTKTGKVVTVKQHTAKYDAAEALKEAAKKKGAGDELEKLKKVKPEKVKVEKPVEDAPDYGFTADEYKAWYHWDQDADPKNKSALKVEKALKKQMGTKAYNKYFDEMSDNYSSRGHNKAFKGLGEKLSAGEDKKASTSASTKSVTPAKETKSVKGPKESTTLVAHVDGDNSIKYKVTPTSPMVKDVAFTKYLADDTYSETFPKGGSYEFFYAKRNKGGDVGLYAKRGNDIFELEETEPSKALAKKLGGSSSREKKSAFKETKADSSEYGKAPKHLGMTQQEWNDWMDGGAGYKAADKKAKAHLEKLYGKDGAKAIRKKYEGDGSNKYIDLVSKATADKKILSEIGGSSKSKESSKESSTAKSSSDDFKVSDSTMRKIDQRIKKLENFKVKMWGHPERAKQAAVERKREIRDLKKAKEYLASGDRQKAARLLTNDSDYGTFKRSEFYSKAEIKSQKEKSAKQKAKKEQDAYNKKLESARSVLAEHEKKQAAEKRKAGKQKIAQLKEKGYALVRTGATGSYYAKKGSRTVYNPDGTKAIPSQAEYALAKLAGRKPRRLK